MFAIILACAVLALLVFCLVLLVTLLRLRKRVNYIFGAGDDRRHLEKKLLQCLSTVSAVDAKYDEVLESIAVLDRRLEFCVQKVGMVRYNPFDNMGGDLSFALALLNGRDEGVVINGIYSRDYSYTYGKPVKNITSKYPLSDEEKAAIRLAMECERTQ
jgi:hypothetical protein